MLCQLRDNKSNSSSLFWRQQAARNKPFLLFWYPLQIYSYHYNYVLHWRIFYERQLGVKIDINRNYITVHLMYDIYTCGRYVFLRNIQLYKLLRAGTKHNVKPRILSGTVFFFLFLVPCSASSIFFFSS